MNRWLRAAFLAATGMIALPAGAQVPGLVHQEGVLVNANRDPVAGAVDLRFALFPAQQGGMAAWSEDHARVGLVEGYYSVILGATRPLTGDLLAASPWLEISVNGGALAPRTRMVSVPFALLAQSVRGGVADVTHVAIGGNVVIDPQGRWRGDPTGLVGPAGPQGPAGAQGPAGQAGGNGSPDTPAQVLAKLLQVDGANSTLDADLLDNLSSDRFMRTDVDTGTTGRLTVERGATFSNRGVEVEGPSAHGFLTVRRTVANAEVGVKWRQADDILWTAFVDQNDTDLRFLRAANGFNDGAPQLRIAGNGDLVVGGGLNAARASRVGGELRIGPTAALVVGQDIDARAIAADQPSGVVGFAGYGIRHGAIGFYPHQNRMELYDTSPAGPHDGYASGSRPYVSLRALDLEARGRLSSIGGLVVNNVVVIDGNGNWVGPRVSNADRLDGLDSADFARADHQHPNIGAGGLNFLRDTQHFNGLAGNAAAAPWSYHAFNSASVTFERTVVAHPFNENAIEQEAATAIVPDMIGWHGWQHPFVVTRIRWTNTGAQQGRVLQLAMPSHKLGPVTCSAWMKVTAGNVYFGQEGAWGRFDNRAWQRVTVTFQAANTLGGAYGFGAGPNEAVSEAYVALPMCELGTQASAWSVAPPDMPGGAGDQAAQIADLQRRMADLEQVSMRGTWPALFSQYTALGNLCGNGLCDDYPASWSHGNSNARGDLALGGQTREGLLAFTDGGRFQHTSQDRSDSDYWTSATWFVRAPAARNVTLDLTCTDCVVEVNGVNISQGAVGHAGRGNVTFAVVAGSNVVSVRSLHHSDWSAVNTWNRWIVDHGLEIDWAALMQGIRGQ